jgi:hypothetical protein
MIRIAIISCSSLKLSHAAPARELYRSPLFRKSLELAELSCDHVYIASAFHGLVELHQELEPYDRTLAELGQRGRFAWGDRIASSIMFAINHHKAIGRLDNRRHEATELVLYAGELYTKPIKRALHFRPVDATILEPLAHMQIGERLRWLNAAIGVAREVRS